MDREQVIRTEERKRLAGFLIGLADNIVRDPEADAIDDHVSAVLRELGDVIEKHSSDELVDIGLKALVEEVIAENQAIG